MCQGPGNILGSTNVLEESGWRTIARNSEVVTFQGTGKMEGRTNVLAEKWEENYGTE